MLIPIQCPNCGNTIASRGDRPAHDVLIQSARVRGTWRWSAIASCDARIVGAGDSFEAAIVALDAVSDALNSDILPSQCEVSHHTPRTTMYIDRLPSL